VVGDQVESEISSPPGPIACADVTGFEIKTWRFGRLILLCALVGFLALGGVVLYSFQVADEGPNLVSIAALVALPLAGIRLRRKVLYSIFLLTSKPGKERIRFYRTFSQLDLALLLDVMTFWVGDRPRKLT
jgi:hypothetical protein